MDLIHPHDAGAVCEALREASAAGTRVLPVGGRQHLDKGNPCEIDAELWTTLLDGIEAYDPAEMLVVVRAGTRVGDLRRELEANGQEWPVDVADDATVGGAIAAGVATPRQLRVGMLRDTVVEMEVATGDGRLVKSGARTVKNVTGFDVHRLLTGSLGTLGVITQVALKLRPIPRQRRTLVTSEGGPALGNQLLHGVPLPTAVVAEEHRVAVRLEGWPEEVEEQTAAARKIVACEELDAPFPEPIFPDSPIVVEVAVPPSRLEAALEGRTSWRALMGIGLAWVPVMDADDLASLREAVKTERGIAPVIRGPGGLGAAPVPAPDVQRRIKAALDPAGILAPRRAWI
ncbi:MAG TPA: FAD-binding protein [Actinomycetota bacterium]|nr:FAD-binding protein [Actinomycetota bacterium]